MYDARDSPINKTATGGAAKAAVEGDDENAPKGAKSSGSARSIAESRAVMELKLRFKFRYNIWPPGAVLATNSLSWPHHGVRGE